MSGHDSELPTRSEIAARIARTTPARLKTICLVLAALGLIVFAVGAISGSDRAWTAWHVSWLYFTSISSAAIAIVAVQRITTARWSRSVVRLLEGFVAFLPVAFVMLLLTIFVGKGHVFPFVHNPPPQLPKQEWLNPVFWSLRGVVIFGVIASMSLWYVYTSVRLDVGILPEYGASWARGIRDRMRKGFGEERRELHSTHSRQGRLAVILVILFAFGWIVLSWDLSMSTDTQFQSTMYGWLFFMGGWLEAIMAWSILVRLWQRFLHADDLITERHFHDIGKLGFAFTAFWGYLTFGQLLVIWYGNVAEETHGLRKVLIAPWTSLAVLVGMLTFVLPFFGLLGVRPKVKSPWMIFFAVCSLTGLWINRYLEIYPGVYQQMYHAIPIGIYEIAIFLGYLGIWGWCYLSFMDAFPKMRVFLMTSPYRDEVQVPVDPATMEPLPAHE